MMKPTAEQVIEAVRACGSDPRDLRDAAHEASHALDVGLEHGQWDRESIHSAVMQRGRAFAVLSEIKARAVEQMVCADLGIDPGDVKRWALIACMEAVKNGIALPGLDWFVERVTNTMQTPPARKMADRVLRLASRERR